ncbi:hypothetical protein BVH03_17205 [Pseudomonas sp. PA15(2017)]|uniref:hypothetical protein n=1 Tax=Pseudomonas sp. PA15(2017) TaxID=1932111 RepID=UPI000968488C|nr:hypothetical protein [Pseudomonas sp. PA15(2017)]OLU25887.1 hypothetical protein BVH03_17205 [Pseudomonas sp. PA15(2017)]
MAQAQPGALPVHASLNQALTGRPCGAHRRIVFAVIVFGAIILLALGAVAGTPPSVQALMLCSLPLAAAWWQFSPSFSNGGCQPIATGSLPAQQVARFYRNARRTVPDVVRIPDAASDLRTTA